MINYLTTQEFQLIRSSNKLCIFVATAPWCGQCDIYKPVINNLSNENIDNVLIYLLDVDKEPNIVNLLNISSIPTTVFFCNNIVYKKESGYRNLEYLKTQINNIMNEIKNKL